MRSPAKIARQRKVPLASSVPFLEDKIAEASRAITKAREGGVGDAYAWLYKAKRLIDDLLLDTAVELGKWQGRKR